MSPLKLYTLRQLTGRPLSTTFALVSMALVAFTLASLSSIGVSLSQVFSTDESPALVLVKEHNSDAEWTSHVEIQDLGRITQSPQIKRSSVETLLMSAFVPGHGAPIDYLQVRGVDPVGFDLHHVQLVSGRMPSPDAEEAIIGEALWKHYKDQLGEGAKLEVHRKYNFTIVGVYRTGTPLDNEVWTHRAALTRRQNDQQRQSFSVAYLETPSQSEAQAVVDQIGKEKGLPVDAMIAPVWRQAIGSAAFSPLYHWLILINVLVALGVLLAAASQLTILLLRRTSDMTVLRVLGFPFRRIVFLVLGEVEVLAIVGGLIGIAVAAAVLHGVSLQASGPSVGVNFEPALQPMAAAQTLGIIVVIGLLAAVIPLLRLARSEVARELR